MSGDQWYSNKDLFEMVQGIRHDFASLRQDLAETRQLVRQYNGLRESLGTVAKRLDALENRAAGKAALADGARTWSGWLVAIVGALWTWWRWMQ